jgi:hypothetical protein
MAYAGDHGQLGRRTADDVHEILNEPGLATYRFSNPRVLKLRQTLHFRLWPALSRPPTPRIAAHCFPGLRGCPAQGRARTTRGQGNAEIIWKAKSSE